MITTCNAKDATVFDPWKAPLSKLAAARAICMQTLEAHNMGWEHSLDRDALERVRWQKFEIEEAAKERFNVKVWRV